MSRHVGGGPRKSRTGQERGKTKKRAERRFLEGEGKKWCQELDIMGKGAGQKKRYAKKVCSVLCKHMIYADTARLERSWEMDQGEKIRERGICTFQRATKS